MTLGELLCVLLVAVGVGMHDLAAGLIAAGLLGFGVCVLLELQPRPELTVDELGLLLEAALAAEKTP